MRAILLAAGRGARLHPHTVDRPKCLVPLAGRPLLDYHLDALRACGVEDRCIVTGYRAEQIERLGHRTVHNPRFEVTNMCASLMAAAAWLDGGDDVLVGYGDIIYEPRVLRALLSCPAPLATVVDRCWRRLWEVRMGDPLADAETLRMDSGGRIVELGGTPRSYADIEGQYVGLTKIAAGFAPQWVRQFERLSVAERDALAMTNFLQRLIDRGCAPSAVCVAGGWLEVDTADDLQRYHELLEQGRMGEFIELPALVGG